MRIHIVGVAGTGMAALAGLLVEAGHQVSGSDVGFHPPMGPRLEGWGVKCLQGFSAEHLEPKPDLVVVGNVCRRDNPEARAALDHGLEVTHIAGALQRFALPHAVPLVVAGTHGKTTTSALTAWLAERVGLTPGFFIGGVAENFGRGFRLPRSGSPMVLEGDEYDTAFFEKTAKVPPLPSAPRDPDVDRIRSRGHLRHRTELRARLRTLHRESAQERRFGRQ